jgi:hypothetical protein
MEVTMAGRAPSETDDPAQMCTACSERFQGVGCKQCKEEYKGRDCDTCSERFAPGPLPAFNDTEFALKKKVCDEIRITTSGGMAVDHNATNEAQAECELKIREQMSPGNSTEDGPVAVRCTACSERFANFKSGCRECAPRFRDFKTGCRKCAPGLGGKDCLTVLSPTPLQMKACESNCTARCLEMSDTAGGDATVYTKCRRRCLHACHKAAILGTQREADEANKAWEATVAKFAAARADLAEKELKAQVQAQRDTALRLERRMKAAQVAQKNWAKLISKADGLEADPQGTSFKAFTLSAAWRRAQKTAESARNATLAAQRKDQLAELRDEAEYERERAATLAAQEAERERERAEMKERVLERTNTTSVSSLVGQINDEAAAESGTEKKLDGDVSTLDREVRAKKRTRNDAAFTAATVHAVADQAKAAADAARLMTENATAAVEERRLQAKRDKQQQAQRDADRKAAIADAEEAIAADANATAEAVAGQVGQSRATSDKKLSGMIKSRTQLADAQEAAMKQAAKELHEAEHDKATLTVELTRKHMQSLEAKAVSGIDDELNLGPLNNAARAAVQAAEARFNECLARLEQRTVGIEAKELRLTLVEGGRKDCEAELALARKAARVINVASAKRR